MPGCPSGQREQTVNLPAMPTLVRIHHPALALLAQLAEHFHGKEEVSGSNPEEGSVDNKFWRRSSVGKSARLIIVRSAVQVCPPLRKKKENKMASDKRPPITLVCTECGDHNYVTTKNKTNTPDRLELMKYSPRLRKHTLHREKR